MILFILSLVAGILTVLAPCTISLLPVIVGGAVGEGGGERARSRAYVVTLSLGASVIAFTLLLKVSTSLINVPQEFWQYVSGGIIFLLGLTMVFPVLWERLKIVSKVNRSSNKLLATGYQKKSFVGDILIGAALGPVFSSCSPTYFLIIATVLPRSIGAGLIYLLAYTAGLCGGLLVVTLLSQKIIEKLGIAADPNGWLKRVIGLLFVLLGLAIVFGADKQAELVVANHIFDVTKIEQALIQNNDVVPVHPLAPSPLPASSASSSESSAGASSVAGSSSASSPTADVATQARLAKKAALYPLAPEITNPSGFINTNGQPITIGQFKGKKVVLIDFWTYSCINCQRTIPYVKAWYDKYSSQGLEIISIHTPEFAFEKVQANVENAVKNIFGIKYPVVLDNDYGTWGAFANQYWPRKYLIDIDGYVVYDHAGEGDYDVTEAAIQKALAERAQVLGISGSMPQGALSGTVAPADAVSVNDSQIGSQETYFGSNRNQFLANGTQGAGGLQTLSLPTAFAPNSLYLSGAWNFNPEFAETKDAAAKVIYQYQAKDVYFVASAAASSPAGAHLRILVDGKPVTTGTSASDFAGADVGADGTVLVKENRLYKIVHGQGYGTHTLEIDVLDGTLDAYTFTFG